MTTLVTGPERDQRVQRRAWLRALELTATITKNPERILPAVIDELAEESGQAPALLADGESLTFGALAERSNRYARWPSITGSRKATSSAC